MTVVIINPNSTEAMTRAMVGVAKVVAPTLEVEGWTSVDGPPAIEGAEDGVAATEPLLRLVERAEAAGSGGIVIGCFDDTALAEAARLASCPVLGIGQAAYHYCALRQWRFSVVTTLPASVPVLEANIGAYGLSDRVGRVRASTVPVLDLEREPERAVGPILAEAEAAVREDDIDAIILGCAGMTRVVERVQAELDIPVVDPVRAGMGCMAWMQAR